MSSLVLSDNDFTGKLPAEIFSSSSLLRTFGASKNCFTGTIPTEICQATGLEILAISSLTSSCSSHFGFGAFFVREVPGDLPACLFAMPNLVQFLAAGNKIRGPLYPLAPESKLANLTLSYNRLHGKIPMSFKEHTLFDVLDLSYNNLVGTLTDMGDYNLSVSDTHSTQVHLRRNMLSGFIPSVYTAATATVHLLDGNMFQCRSTNDLPHGDPDVHNYSCGSDLLDVVLYLWLALIVTLLLLVCVLWHVAVKAQKARNSGSAHGQDRFLVGDIVRVLGGFLLNTSTDNSKHTSPSSRPLSSRRGVAVVTESLIQHSGLVLSTFRMFCFRFTVLVVVVFMPMFTVLSYVGANTSLSQTYQYGWTISMAFIKGEPAAIVVTLAWTLLLLYNMYFEANYIDRNPVTAIREIPQDAVGVPATIRKIMLVLANITITFAANSLYVWIVLTQSLAVQATAAGIFVLYKVSYMYLVVVPWLERMSSKFVVILTILLLNVIVIPVVTTLSLDSACFQNIVVATEPIEQVVSYRICRLFGQSASGEFCTQYDSVDFTLTVAAPFIYSDRCWTAVLTNYIPIYVLTYGIVGVVIPVIQIVTTIYCANAAITGDKVLLRWIRKIKTVEWFPIYYMFPLESVDDLVSSDKSIKKHFYLSRFNSINCVLLLTLLFSVGVAYSPLAIMLLLNITCTTLAFQLSIYYHSQQIKLLPAECMAPWCEVLTSEIGDMHKIVFGSRTTIYLFSSVFVALGIYDMIESTNFPLTMSLAAVVVGATAVGNRLLKHRRAVNDLQLRLMAEVSVSKYDSVIAGSSQQLSSGMIEMSSAAIAADKVARDTPSTLPEPPSRGASVADTAEQVFNPIVNCS
jgi:hypothetical protein